MAEYLVTIAASDKRNLSVSEEQECLTGYQKWAAEIGDKHVIARRLALTDGKLLPPTNGVITDGPFVEAKELIAGIIILEADSLEHASEIALSCPLRKYFQLFVKEVN